MDHERDLLDIIVAAHALTRTAALETRDETPTAQWRTLGILLEHGPLRIGDLARVSRVTQPGMTRLIGTMTRARLVDREPDPDDSRAVRVAVTEKGAGAYAAWRSELASVLLPRFADLDAAQWDAIRTAADLLAQRTAGTDAVIRRSNPGEETSGR